MVFVLTQCTNLFAEADSAMAGLTIWSGILKRNVTIPVVSPRRKEMIDITAKAASIVDESAAPEGICKISYSKGKSFIIVPFKTLALYSLFEKNYADN